MDVLCTDKTGTLTEARIALAGHARRRRGCCSWRRSNAALAQRHRSPLDDAILGGAAGAGGLADAADVPFDFDGGGLRAGGRDGRAC